MTKQKHVIHTDMRKYERPAVTVVAMETDSIIAASLPLGHSSNDVPAEQALSKQIDIWQWEELEEEE